MTLLVLARSFHIGSAMLLFGILFFDAITLRSDRGANQKSFDAFRRHLARWFLAVLFIQWLSGAAWLFVATSQMAECNPWYAVSGADWQTVLGQTQFGKLWLIRAGLALALTVAAAFRFWRPRPIASRFALLLSFILLVSLAWAGHAGSGRDLQAWRLSADALHLATGAVWPLGLIPLALFLATPACMEDRDAFAIIRRFSRYSLAAVCLLIFTGIVNSWFLVGSWSNLFETFYGRLLLAKIFLFAVMITFGACNRRILGSGHVSMLEDQGRVHLRRNVVIESLLAFFILLIVGVMGASAPPR